MWWHGGASYASGTIAEDTEAFESLDAAKRSFDARADSWNTYYPCVERVPVDDGGPSAWIFFADPNEDRGQGEPYPDRILEYGPRGGLRLSYA
jgi:hypothetical protein